MPKGLKLLDAYVEVSADGSNIVGDVKKKVDGDSSRLKGSGMGIGKALVGGIVGSIAVAQIGSFLGDSISKSSDLNETINKASVIFGAQSASMEKWAGTAATTLGLSKEAALASAAGFGDMFTQIGFTGDAAAKMSKSVVTAAADLGSFSNLDTADVSDRIAAAMRGEYDSLQAVIPNINAARVESEALAATGKATAKELTAQDKATAVLAIVSKDGARAMGDFAKTSDSMANRQKIAAAQTADLQAAIGTGLAPIINELMGFVVSVVLPALQGFATWVSQNTSVVIPLAVALGVLAAVVWVVNAALAANPIVLIIIAIGALIAAIVLLVMNWDTVVKFLLDVWGGFIGWISDGLRAFAAWWNSIWAAVGAWIVSVWQGFVNFILAVWNGYINLLRAGLNGLLGWWNGIWAAFGATISAIWQGIVNGVSGAIGGVIGFVQGIHGRIMGAVAGAGNWLINAGRDIIQGFIDGINGMIGAVGDAIGGVMDFVGGFFPHSPAKRGPFSGSGWDAVKGAGIAIGDHFDDGLDDTLPSPFGDRVSPLSSRRGSSSGSGTGATAGAGTVIHIEHVTIDAKNVSDWQKAVETLRNLGQTSRQGQGVRTTAGMSA